MVVASATAKHVVLDSITYVFPLNRFNYACDVPRYKSLPMTLTLIDPLNERIHIVRYYAGISTNGYHLGIAYCY